MRRLLTTMLVTAILGVGLFGLREATQNRPDVVREGTATELTLHVRTKGGYSPLLGAQGLWAMCQQTVSDTQVREPLAQVGDGRFTIVVEPALGTNAGKRLGGCLEDATVPRVSADLTDRRDLIVE